MLSWFGSASAKRKDLSSSSSITTIERTTAHKDKRKAISISRTTIFGSKSNEWHRQIEFTTGLFRPSDPNFPWEALRKHTNVYLKRKGKLSQSDIDIRLGLLIMHHPDRMDTAVAACAHAMTPGSVRDILSANLKVAPATFFGLEIYLQSIIAANHGNQSFTDLEAQWAAEILPFATQGTAAARRYLAGFSQALRTTNVSSLDIVPEFSSLAGRALDDFACQLQGYKLRCQWVSAYNSITWMSDLVQKSPSVTPPGKLLPEHVFDSRFPLWRTWAAWRPNWRFIKALDALDEGRRGVLPDILALDGPDFITGRCPSLKEGIVAQYGAAKSQVRSGSLVIEVPSCSKESLREILGQLNTVTELVVTGPNVFFDAFVALAITRPVTKDSLQVLEVFSRMSNGFADRHKVTAITNIWLAEDKIGGGNVSDLRTLLDEIHQDAGTLRTVILRQPWFIPGIDNCIRECQSALLMEIVPGKKWTPLVHEFHALCLRIQDAVRSLSLRLSDNTQQLLSALPSAALLACIFGIYEIARGMHVELGVDSNSKSHKNILQTAVEDYCIDKYVTQESLRKGSQDILKAVVNVFESISCPERQTLAVMAAEFTGKDAVRLDPCLSQLSLLSNKNVRLLLSIMARFSTDRTASCMDFTDLLTKNLDDKALQAWKGILYQMLDDTRGDDHIRYVLEHFSVKGWYKWMSDLDLVFHNIIKAGDFKASPPLLLRCKTHLRLKKLSEYIETLDRFMRNTKAVRAIQCFLQCFIGDDQDFQLTLETFQSLREIQTMSPEEEVMQQILESFSGHGTEPIMVIALVFGCVGLVADASRDCVEACNRVIDLDRDGCIPTAVTEAIVAGWLEVDGNEKMTDVDKSLIKNVAFLFGIATYENGIPPERVLQAAKYYQSLEQGILRERDELNNIRDTMESRDRKGTRIFLQQIGYPSRNHLDDEITSLPVGICDVVEKRGENNVEISFPLTSFTDLQRAATGIGKAKNLLVSLYLVEDSGMPPSFCIHLDTDPMASRPAMDHEPCICFEDANEPENIFCGGYGTSLTVQMFIILYRYITQETRTKKHLSIVDVHDAVKKRLENYAHFCMACDCALTPSLNLALRRPLPCKTCITRGVWPKLPLAVRIPEIRTDPFAVDLLLTAVYASANESGLDLLPLCPIPTRAEILSILNAFPKLSVLKDAVNPSAVLKEYHPKAETLLLYACTQYQGFISSAMGITKIPGLPAGTHQFVVANNMPALEAQFKSALPHGNPTTRVLFHGTSLARLFPILTSGLKNFSGTTLQRHGQTYGAGIYMGEEPQTSWHYMPGAISWRNSGLNNMKVLLGCEVVGKGNSVKSGIHLIKDDKQVMVRYVFLFTGQASAPVARHITTPMLSAMHALRSGSV